MTVRVVSDPAKFRNTCNHCKAVLEYEGSDLKVIDRTNSRSGPRVHYGVVCPACLTHVMHVNATTTDRG